MQLKYEEKNNGKTQQQKEMYARHFDSNILLRHKNSIALQMPKEVRLRHALRQCFPLCTNVFKINISLS